MALADVLGQLAVDELREQKYMRKRGSKGDKRRKTGKKRAQGKTGKRKGRESRRWQSSLRSSFFEFVVVVVVVVVEPKGREEAVRKREV